MSIELSPELEAIIQQRLQSGGFQSVEEVLLDALEMQQQREEWLQANKTSIDTKIARGLDQLDRGQGIPSADLRERLEVRKSKWLSENTRS